MAKAATMTVRLADLIAAAMAKGMVVEGAGVPTPAAAPAPAAAPKVPAPLTFAVSGKGCFSIYGLGRFPVSLYENQVDRLLNAASDLKRFLEANRGHAAVVAARSRK